jgi:hypothetical protein
MQSLTSISQGTHPGAWLSSSSQSQGRTGG